MTNIFLACALAFTVFYAVDSSFITAKDQSLNIQTDNVAELERTYLEKQQLVSTKSSAIKLTSQIKNTSKIKEIKNFAQTKKENPFSIRVNVNSKKKIARKVTPKVEIEESVEKAVNKIEIKNLESKNELELSFKEHPEQKIVVIRKIKHIAWTKIDTKLKNYDKQAYAKNENIKLNDRISTALSAQEKSSNKLIKNDVSEVALNSKSEVKVVAGDDELVFFDYGSPKKNSEVVEFQTESPKKKPSAKLAQLGALGSQTVTTTTAKSDPIMEMIKKEFTKPNRAKGMIAKTNLKPTPPRPAPKSEPDYECLDKRDLTINQTYKTNYSLQLLEVDYKRKNTERISNFELQFHDDTNLYKEDFGSGEINLSFKMNSQISIRRATILARGYYPTTLDMVFEPGSVNASIPVFTLSSFNKILSNYGLRGLGSHALIELDDKTEDVEIDISKKYEAKLYLDKDFNVVSRQDSAYNYVLFIGVAGGNAILNFKRSDKKIVNKLVYLSSDQIYYESNFYAEVKRDVFSFYREGILTKCKSMVNIDPKEVRPWNYSGRVVKDSLNSVKLSNMIYPVGSKKYVEVRYDGLVESIFVGRWGHENIVVPTERYIGHVMDQFGRNANSNSCIMQLNITKQVKDIAFNGQSANKNMDMQIRILDGDGEFYQDFSDRSERVFLMGQEEGTVNIAIDYVDGSKQYLQSFCSDATYIVEQL